MSCSSHVNHGAVGPWFYFLQRAEDARGLIGCADEYDYALGDAQAMRLTAVV
jgi:hypothetical protein